MSHNKVIHVVEDEAEVRKSLVFRLQVQGFNIIEYCSGEEFINSYERHDVECVLLDMLMPNNVNGDDVYKYIVDNNLMIPCVFVTGHAPAHLVVEMIQKGAVDYLVKPVDDLKLCKSIYRGFEICVTSREAQSERDRYHQKVDTLTPIEKEAYKLMKQNLSNGQMSDIMLKGKKSIEKYRSNVISKLGFETAFDLCLFCKEKNL